MVFLHLIPFLFSEFIVGLSNFSSASALEKIRFAFLLYDADNSGQIEVGELRDLIGANLAGCGVVNSSEVRSISTVLLILFFQVDKRVFDIFRKLRLDFNPTTNTYPPLTYEHFMEIAKERPELLLPPHALPADHPFYKPAPVKKKVKDGDLDDGQEYIPPELADAPRPLPLEDVIEA